MSRRRGDGQFCPVAKAAEVLAERWTPLIVRELLTGRRRFGELQQGIPLISPTMLSRRLRELEAAEVIERTSSTRGKDQDSCVYQLTSAGKDFAPVIENLGIWGKRWALAELRREDLDPDFLIWALHKNLRVETLAGSRAVIAFELTDAPAKKRHWWIIAHPDGEVDVCLKHPGYQIDATVAGQIRTLAQLLLGAIEPADSLRSGAIRLEGERRLVRSFCDWCPRSRFADVKKAARGE